MSGEKERQEVERTQIETVLEKLRRVSALVFSAVELISIADRRTDRAAKIHCGVAALLSESEIISHECRHRLQSILPEEYPAISEKPPLDMN